MSSRPQMTARSPMTASTIAMDSRAAIATTVTELNAVMTAFDRWASQNPEKLEPNNSEFKAMKQVVKLLRLRIKDQQSMQRTYENVTRALQDENLLLSDNLSASAPFVKSRNTEELRERPGIRLGSRPGIKLSRG